MTSESSPDERNHVLESSPISRFSTKELAINSRVSRERENDEIRVVKFAKAKIQK